MSLGGLSSSNYWQLGGNNISPGQSIGTLNNQSLELVVNGARGLRIEPNGLDAPNLIGGSSANSVATGVTGAVIGGGSFNTVSNGAGSVVIDGGLNNAIADGASLSKIGGGSDNLIGAGAYAAIVNGGKHNTVEAWADVAVIGGGEQNKIQSASADSVIGGGNGNVIQPNAMLATISGGGGNNIQTNASGSTIGGGESNIIQRNANDSTIGGGAQNVIQALTADSTIGGGANNVIQLSADHSTIGGGGNNTIQTNASYSTISGGRENSIQLGSTHSTIGGGWQNSVQSNSYLAVIAGGNNNVIQSNATFATIGGGAGNIVQSNSQFATIPGGNLNSATSYAFAAGNQAKANHSGAFVWADSQAVDFPSANSNEFAVRASGGVRLVTGGAGLTVDGQSVISSLPANIVYVNSNQTFTASNTFAGVVKATNGNNSFAGSFAGNGAGLTNLNASQLAAGIVPLAVLSGITSNQLNATTWQLATNLNGGNAALASNVLAGISITNVFITNSTFAGNGAGLTNLSVASLPANIAFVSSNQTFTASNTFAGVVTMTNGSNNVVGSFTGNGGGLTNLNTASFTGTVADARLSANVALLNTNQTFTGSNNFIGALVATNLNSRFAGNGGGLTNLSAANLVGTISDTQLSTNVALLGSSQTFSGAKAMTNAGNIFVGAFTSNGGGLTNLNLGSLSGSNFWTLTGNAGTDSTTNFIGTTDNKDLNFRVFNTRALRVQPVGTSAANLIGGYSGNDIPNGVTGSVIAGGGGFGATNRITDNYAVVGGGYKNVAGDGDGDFNNGAYSVVGGGNNNNAAGGSSVVGGGSSNTNSGTSAVISGGQSNRATNTYAAVAGGLNNLAGGNASMVAGGEQNQALGGWSFAGGRLASANHDGSFVWSDSRTLGMSSTTTNQFLIRAQNGVGINTASPATALDVNGTATVTGFRLSTSPTAGAVLTSDASGNGTWSTSISPVNLPSNLAFVNSNQTFTVSNIFNGVVKATNVNNVFAGDGSGLTNLNPAKISGGTASINITGNAATATTATTATTANGVAPNAVGTSGIQDGAITGSKIADGSVNTNDLSGQVLTNTFWRLTGNAGTDPTSNFIGTADFQALEIKANRNRVVRYEPKLTQLGQVDSPNVIGGSSVNYVTNLNGNLGGVVGAFIGGGGTPAFGSPLNSPAVPNGVGDSYSVLVGGIGNLVSASHSFIGGGTYNTNSGRFAVVTGGSMNTAAATFATVSGGTRNQATGTNSFVGGGGHNLASGLSAVVAGGGGDDPIYGDAQNQALGDWSSVGGGEFNSATALGAVVSGGQFNSALGTFATVGGGTANSAFAIGSTVSGGWQNEATTNYATVPGGDNNHARGQYSFAAGKNAWALHDGSFVWSDTTTVSGQFPSSGSNQFLINARGGVGINTNLTLEGGLTINASTYLLDHNIYLRGQDGTADHNHGLGYFGNGKPFATVSNLLDGPVLYGYFGGALGTGNGVTENIALYWNYLGRVGIGTTTPAHLFQVGNAGSPAYCDGGAWVNGSDRNAKADFNNINPLTVLEKVSSMPITAWRYKTETNGVKHIGPMAQDFHEAFGLNGNDDKHISTVDEGGVALAAIQGLNQKVEQKDAEIQDLKARLEKLEQLVNGKNGGLK